MRDEISGWLNTFLDQQPEQFVFNVLWNLGRMCFRMKAYWIKGKNKTNNGFGKRMPSLGMSLIRWFVRDSSIKSQKSFSLIFTHFQSSRVEGHVDRRSLFTYPLLDRVTRPCALLVRVGIEAPEVPFPL